MIIPFLYSLLFMLLFPRDPYQSDGEEYDRLARNLLEGKGYTLDGLNPYGLRPPLYTFFVSLIYFVFGYSSIPIIIIQLFLVMMVPLFIFKILKISGFNEEEAFWGALFSSLYPFSYIYVQQVITETITTFLFSLAVYLTQKIWNEENGNFIKNMLFGLLITLPALSKSQHLTLIVALIISIFIRALLRKNFYEVIKYNLIPLLLASLLVISPWALRNYYHFGRFSILGEGAYGESILKGFYESKGQWFFLNFWTERHCGQNKNFKDWKLKMEEAEEFAKRERISIGKAKTIIALNEMRKEPFETIRGYLVRFYSFWLMIPTEEKIQIKVLTIMFDISVIFLFILGFLHLKEKIFKNLIVLYFTIFVENAFLATGHIEARYSISLKPFIVMIVGVFIYDFIIKGVKENAKWGNRS